MKNLIVGFLLALTSVTLAATTPLLEKTYVNGHVEPHFAMRTACSIYADRVVVTRRAAGISSVSEKALTTSGDIAALITKASQGKIEETPAPTDGPVTIWNGYLANGHQVRLQAKGSLIQINRAPDATTLINFLDLHCK